MKLKVSRSLIQDMVSKAMKGVSMNKMLPITNLMLIQFANGELQIVTTDALNYLYISEDISESGYESDGDFYVVVQADVFSKLITRLTCETVTLQVEKEILWIAGNGKYHIELPLDEEGELIKYPDPSKSAMNVPVTTAQINLSTIQLMLSTAKSALSTDLHTPCYTGYYMSDKILATDGQVLCSIMTKTFDKPVLLSSSTVDLLGLMNEEEITCEFGVDDDLTAVFSTDKCMIYTKRMDCIGDFQIDVLNNLLDISFDGDCKVNKNEFLALLDRLILFVGPYDNRCIYLNFASEGIAVSSKQNSGIETVNYVSTNGVSTYFTCCVNVDTLMSQIKASVSDIIEIEYGKDNAIKFVDGAISQLICLQVDDR